MRAGEAIPIAFEVQDRPGIGRVWNEELGHQNSPVARAETLEKGGDNAGAEATSASGVR
jgi:hypothetical protein